MERCSGRLAAGQSIEFHVAATSANGFTNDGDLIFKSDYLSTAKLTIVNGKLINGPLGSVRFVTSFNGISPVLDATLDNRGTVQVDQSAVLAHDSAQHTNSGLINVAGGNFTVTQTGISPSFTNSGTIRVAANSTFAINGGSLTNVNSGVITGGTYDVTGIFRAPISAITSNQAQIILHSPASAIQNASNQDMLTGWLCPTIRLLAQLPATAGSASIEMLWWE